MRTANSPTIFISYSHKDTDFYLRLRKYLKESGEVAGVAVTDDKSISVGSDWKAEIDRMIESATAAVTLLSHEYVSSDYLNRIELPELLKKRTAEGLLLIPVMLRPCPPVSIPPDLRDLTMPLGGKPLSEFAGAELDQILFQVSTEIIQAVSSHWEKTSKSAPVYPHRADTTLSTQSAADDESAHEVRFAGGGTSEAANQVADADESAAEVHEVPLAKGGASGAANVVRSRKKARTDATEGPPTPSDAGFSEAEFLSIDRLGFFKFSPEVESIIKRARALGTYTGKTTPRLSTPSLFFAMAEAGRPQSKYYKTPQFLWEQIKKTTTARTYQKAYDEWFVVEHSMPFVLSNMDMLAERARVLSSNAFEILELAEEFSRRTTPEGKGLVSASHLLAALLVSRWKGTQTGAQIYLIRAGLDPVPLSKRFFEFIEKNFPDDNHEEWSKILSEGLAVEADKPNAPQNVAERYQQLAEQVRERVQHQRDKEEAKAIAAKTARPGGAKKAAKGAESLDIISDAAEVDATINEGVRAEDGEALADDADGADSGSALYLSGFHTDDGGGRDLLNIESEVNALASLVAAWSVEPPLSIGLFGHWGSGKTFFMRKMMERVGKLARKARASKKPQRENGYYKNIIQIEFNAWHYIEGNLWASLVEHIFENLRLHGKEQDSAVELRRREVLKQLDVQMVMEARAGEKKQQFIAAKNQARDRAEDAKSRREVKLNLLSSVRQEFAAQTGATQKLKDDITPLAAKVGISIEALSNASELRAAFNETRSLWGRIRAQLSWIRSRPSAERKKFALALVIAAAVSGSLCALAWFVQSASNVPLRGVKAVILPSVAFLSSAWLVLRPHWRTVSAAVSEVLSFLESKQREFAQAEALAEEEQRKRIVELESEISALSNKIVEAEEDEARASRRVRELQEELENTTPGRMLAEFIEDRAAASDYRRHLGVLAVIRRDFEKLARLISDQRKAERKGEEKIDDPTTINRIILYVDDLDRCPPERVVQVLQAIHLLLAFPLFVVVVGVDARWVSRSLRERYDFLLRNHEVESRQDELMASLGPGATPHDYLEKIFQIPYWLRPLEETGCKSLIEGLTKDSLASKAGASRPPDTDAPPREPEMPPPAASSEAGDTTKPAPPPDAPEEETRAETQAEQPNSLTNGLEAGAPKGDTPEGVAGVEPASAPDHVVEEEEPEDEDDPDIDPHPKNLDLEDYELLFMQELAHVVGRSPRAVKRFINCYRLIKVGKGGKRLQKFLGDGGAGSEYRAVMLMLGIVTGVPDISQQLIELLRSHPEGETLQSFVRKVDKEPDIKGHPDWARAKVVLANYAKKEGGQVPLGPLAQAASGVARYSFRVSQAEHQAPPSQRQVVPGDGAPPAARAKPTARAPRNPAARSVAPARVSGSAVSDT